MHCCIAITCNINRLAITKKRLEIAESKGSLKLVNSSRVLVCAFRESEREHGHCFRVLKYSAMSALDITAALGFSASPPIHYNYAGELVRIFRLKRRGVATGISNRAREDANRPLILMVSH